MASLVIGRIQIKHKGEWSPGETYTELDMVRHNGSAYTAVKTTLNEEPGIQNDTSWELVCQKGDKGSLGISDIAISEVGDLIITTV